MLELLLIRHGQTDWNVERKVMGRSPIPLNTTGRAQARSLAKGLKDIPIHAIYTSPTKRTMQTAQILMKGRETVPFMQEEGLTEIEYGQWVGSNINDLLPSAEFQAYLKRPLEFSIPGGETVTGAMQRAVAVVEKIRSSHADQRVAAFSHADVIRAIVVHYLKLPLNDWQGFSVDNAAMSILQFREEKARLVTLNCQGEWGRYFAI